MTELQGHEDRLEISADSGVFVRSRAEGSHGRSRVGGTAPSLCQRARCYQSHPWDLHPALRIRHRGRDLGNPVAFGQKPDGLKVPRRRHVRAGPVLLLQSRNAQMIGHMRQGSPPRLLALQSILSPNRRESLPTPSAGVRITSLERPVVPAPSPRQVLADFGPIYAANGFVGFVFAATGPVAIILSVGTSGGLSPAELASWIFGVFFINGLIVW